MSGHYNECNFSIFRWSLSSVGLIQPVLTLVKGFWATATFFSTSWDCIEVFHLLKYGKSLLERHPSVHFRVGPPNSRWWWYSTPKYGKLPVRRSFHQSIPVIGSSMQSYPWVIYIFCYIYDIIRKSNSSCLGIPKINKFSGWPGFEPSTLSSSPLVYD